MTYARNSLGTKLGGLAAAVCVRSWMGTLDYQVAMYDPTVDPVRADFRGPVIAVFWHEGLLLPFYLRGRTRTAILTSRHRDAHWLSEAARHLGFKAIRGSTHRGGSRALLELLRGLEHYNVGVASDGPRGPRRKMAQGPVYLSSKLGIPLVAYGIGYDRPWRMPTWDRFALPAPFSRARLVMGPRMQIPANLDRDGLERYRVRVEGVLNRLTLEAEAWAHAGSRKVNQCAIRPAAAPPRRGSQSDQPGAPEIFRVPRPTPRVPESVQSSRRAA